MAYQDAIEMIRAELGKKRMQQNKLAERSGLSNSQVSRIFSGESTASQEALTALAVALDLKPEMVLRVAGLLPPVREADPWAEMVAHLGTRVKDPAARKRITRQIEMEIEEEEEAAEAAKHAGRGPSQARITG